MLTRPREPGSGMCVLRHMIALLPMATDDLAEVLELWRQTAGVGLNESDSPEALVHFLARNSALSRVAREGETVVAAVLCGHDGRRGFLYHLAVLPEFRRQGLGGELVEQCLAGLAAAGIQKCNALVYNDNAAAQGFWRQLGFNQREDLGFWQRTITRT